MVGNGDLQQPATRRQVHDLADRVQKILETMRDVARDSRERIGRLEQRFADSPSPQEVGMLLAEFRRTVADVESIRREHEVDLRETDVRLEKIDARIGRLQQFQWTATGAYGLLLVLAQFVEF